MLTLYAKSGLDKNAIEWILRFIRTRHFGDVSEALRYQKKLMAKLGGDYTAVLMKHGDPDKSEEDYFSVMDAWFKEESQL